MKKSKHGDYQTIVRFPAFNGFKIFMIVTDCIVRSVIARYPESDPDRFSSCPALTIRAETNSTHMFFHMDTLFKPYELAGNLAHESWHAVRNMLKWAGVDDCPFDSEVVAYHLGFTVERATKFFQEVRNDHQRGTKHTTASA